MERQHPTPERIRELLSYDPATGEFRWRETCSRRQTRSGQIAGCICPRGYRLICIEMAKYRANRLAFLLMNGRWPDGLMDHKNGDPSDDRWVNLREATFAENTANRRVTCKSKTGLKGVVFRPKTGRWEASIKSGYKAKYLGMFDTPEAAHAAYLDAAKRIFGDFARLE